MRGLVALAQLQAMVEHNDLKNAVLLAVHVQAIQSTLFWQERYGKSQFTLAHDSTKYSKHQSRNSAKPTPEEVLERVCLASDGTGIFFRDR